MYKEAQKAAENVGIIWFDPRLCEFLEGPPQISHASGSEEMGLSDVLPADGTLYDCKPKLLGESSAQEVSKGAPGLSPDQSRGAELLHGYDATKGHGQALQNDQQFRPCSKQPAEGHLQLGWDSLPQSFAAQQVRLLCHHLQLAGNVTRPVSLFVSDRTTTNPHQL